MKRLNRRDFLKTSLLATGSLGMLPALAADNGAKPPTQASAKARNLGANGDIRLAVVGFGGRGQNHLEGLREVKGVRLVALCDVDGNILEKELAKCRSLGEQVQGYTDIRKLLENQGIDVVSFATPNHWHALGSIWAIQSGKDVYVEKPVSHNVWEGRQLVDAARKYNRIVQTGTQLRSCNGIREAIQWLHEGHLGKIARARGICYKRRPSIGKVDSPQPIPSTVNYDLWCGPGPKEPLRRKHLHYDWHWVWPTGNGDLGNQGAHQMDLARWALGETGLSARVLSVGGRLGYVDDGTTPNTQIVFHDYATAPLIFEVRGLPVRDGSEKTDQYRGVGIGLVVDCEGGSLVIPNSFEPVIYDREGKQINQFKGSTSHFANFINAVRSRKPSDLHADILEGHLSSALCHTANISYRLGKPQSPEAIREAVNANPDLAETLGRMEQHLGANNVDLRKTPATLGVVLNLNPKSERFVDNPQADQMLTREYREPFVVPRTI